MCVHACFNIRVSVCRFVVYVCIVEGVGHTSYLFIDCHGFSEDGVGLRRLRVNGGALTGGGVQLFVQFTQLLERVVSESQREEKK